MPKNNTKKDRQLLNAESLEKECSAYLDKLDFYRREFCEFSAKTRIDDEDNLRFSKLAASTTLLWHSFKTFQDDIMRLQKQKGAENVLFFLEILNNTLEKLKEMDSKYHANDSIPHLKQYRRHKKSTLPYQKTDTDMVQSVSKSALKYAVIGHILAYAFLLTGTTLAMLGIMSLVAVPASFVLTLPLAIPLAVMGMAMILGPLAALGLLTLVTKFQSVPHRCDARKYYDGIPQDKIIQLGHKLYHDMNICTNLYQDLKPGGYERQQPEEPEKKSIPSTTKKTNLLKAPSTQEIVEFPSPLQEKNSTSNSDTELRPPFSPINRSQTNRSSLFSDSKRDPGKNSLWEAKSFDNSQFSETSESLLSKYTATLDPADFNFTQKPQTPKPKPTSRIGLFLHNGC